MYLTFNCPAYVKSSVCVGVLWPKLETEPTQWGDILHYSIVFCLCYANLIKVYSGNKIWHVYNTSPSGIVSAWLWLLMAVACIIWFLFPRQPKSHQRTNFYDCLCEDFSKYYHQKTDKISCILSSMSFEIFLSDIEQSPVSSLYIVLNCPGLILSWLYDIMFLCLKVFSKIIFPDKKYTSSHSRSVWPSKNNCI